MINEALFTSNKQDWVTPQKLYDDLNNEFHFTCDVAADDINHKCNKHFTKECDGLKQKWSGVCWCNPPYNNVSEWVEKAFAEAECQNATTIMLIPARTDTRWFHQYIYNKHEIRFLKGRLKFSGSKNSAPFPSMIVIFKSHKE